MARRQSKSKMPPSRRIGAPGQDDYWTLSTRPLHALALLTPLVLLYELASLLYLADMAHGQMRTIKAKNLLADFMQQFGVVGLLAPGIALLVILLIWHILTRDRWQVRPLVLAGMVLEAALWTLPLLVFGALIKQASGGDRSLAAVGLEVAQWPLVAGNDLLDLSWQARATISLGAGLYEELLFRLVGIALVHFAARDVLRLEEGLSRFIAIAASALAFAFYHRVVMADGSIQWTPLIFYTAAGIYFASLYLYRGFGIVVATHALYDVVVLVLLRPS